MLQLVSECSFHTVAAAAEFGGMSYRILGNAIGLATSKISSYCPSSYEHIGVL